MHKMLIFSGHNIHIILKAFIICHYLGAILISLGGQIAWWLVGQTLKQVIDSRLFRPGAEIGSMPMAT